MKYAKWTTVLMLVMGSTFAAAQLPVSNRLVADVPFTFVVADTVVPLGKCIIQRAGAVDQTLIVQSPNARSTVFALASAGEGKHSAGAYSLVFHRYGRRYFLTGVKLEGSRTVYSFRPSKFEAELLTQNVPATEEILVASLK